jgi:hypothetical protein
MKEQTIIFPTNLEFPSAKQVTDKKKNLF